MCLETRRRYCKTIREQQSCAHTALAPSTNPTNHNRKLNQIRSEVVCQSLLFFFAPNFVCSDLCGISVFKLIYSSNKWTGYFKTKLWNVCSIIIILSGHGRNLYRYILLTLHSSPYWLYSHRWSKYARWWRFKECQL